MPCRLTFTLSLLREKPLLYSLPGEPLPPSFALVSPFLLVVCSETEGQRMLESIHDLFLQKKKAETVAFDSKPDQAIFKKPKNFKRLSKKDISTPCNFKHVSGMIASFQACSLIVRMCMCTGITVQRTQVCEDELRGTIQRKMRSMSLSSLVSRRPKATGELPHYSYSCVTVLTHRW